METSEEWKIISSFPDYSISNKGNVKHNATETIMNKTSDNKGYEYITFRLRVAREVAKAFLPNPENKPHVDHINRVRNDNRLDNLRWATVSENNLNRHIPAHKDNELHQPYISRHKNMFAFRRTINKILVRKYFKTLEEAVLFRDSFGVDER
jgi:hypothetical protein